jgi:hypothetical protein
MYKIKNPPEESGGSSAKSIDLNSYADLDEELR